MLNIGISIPRYCGTSITRINCGRKKTRVIENSTYGKPHIS